MSNEENLKAALQHLISLDEHQDFFDSYKVKKEIKTSDDLDEFFNMFKNHLSNLGKWDSELELTLSIIKEQSDIIKSQKSNSPLFSIIHSRKLNDSWIFEFIEEFNKCMNGDIFVEEIRPRKYKTIIEKKMIQGVDGYKLSDLYTKYSDFNHPYVNHSIASALYNSKDFSNGLPILKEGIKSIISYPIHYWNNEFGIEGAAWLIGDFLYLLGNSFEKLNLKNEKIKLLKLLFLYMSRYICMTQSNLKSIDLYSNRARIVQGNSMYFIEIFGFGINPDIQYMSDMYLAYQISLNNNLTIIPSFKQFFWDSLKMYEHGSHIPNNSGGYKEIEESSWMELVHKGEIRSLMLGDKLLKEFENYELNISNTIIDQLFNHLSETNVDDLENYLKKLHAHKLNKTSK